MKKRLADEIKITGYQIKWHISKDKLERIAKKKKYRTFLQTFDQKGGLDGQAKALSPSLVGAQLH